jgi:hypothetical protein
MGIFDGGFLKKKVIGTPVPGTQVQKVTWGPYNEKHVSNVTVDHAQKVQAVIDEQGVSNEFEIVLPKDNELQLDYDCIELPAQFNEVMDILTQTVPKDAIIEYFVTRSRSGNLHVTIALPYKLGPYQRIAWQAVFGSDPKREALSVRSATVGDKNPTLLIERKGGTPISKGIRVNRVPEPVGRKFRD